MGAARRTAAIILAHALFLAGTLVCRANFGLVATSSNPALLPDSNIQIEWNDDAYIVTFTLSAEESGSSTVHLAITDGLTSTPLVPDFEDHALVVDPPDSGSNAPPIISDLANQAIPSNATAVTLSLIVADSESPANTLSVEASANDATLVPPENISVDGSGEYRTLTVRRMPAQSGATTIDVTVSDGQLTTTESFILSVAPSTPPDGQLQILSLQRMNIPGMIVTWSTVPGEAYQVLKKEQLDERYWVAASPKVTAYGTTAAWLDPTVQGTASRYYLIRKIPATAGAPLTPRLISISSRQYGELTMEWTSVPGAAYRVVAKEGLDQLEWQPVSDSLPATRATMSWTDFDTWLFPGRLYKVEMFP